MSLNFKHYRKQNRAKLLKEQVKEEPEVAPVVQQSAGTGVDDIDAGDVASADIENEPSPIAPDAPSDFDADAPVPQPEDPAEPDLSGIPGGEETPQLAEQYAKKVASLNEKKAKLEEEIAALVKEIDQNTALGQKKFQYDEARASVAALKEELDEMKGTDVVKGGLADGMDNEDIAKMHGVSKEKIDKQVEKGKEVEAEHTDDPKAQEEIAQDHEVEDPEYYDDDDGLDLADVEAEAELDKEKKKKGKMDEGKKKKGPVTSINKEIGEREPIGKYGKTQIKSKKDKARDPKQRRRNDKQKGFENLEESHQLNRYLKESWKRVKKDKPEDNGKNFNFHIG